MARPVKVRLGDILLQQKLISQEQLKLALEQQKHNGRKLGRVLTESGFVSEEMISEALSRQLDVPYINLKHYNVNLDVIRKLPENQSRRFRSLVLEDRKTSLLVGMADPSDLFAYDELSRLLRAEIDIAVVTESQLLETIDRVYRRTEEITGLARELEQELGDKVDFGVLGLGLGAEDAPVVKLLQSVFEDAVQVDASDIHIEPSEQRLKIRFRIDGMLHLQTEADIKIASAMALRLKLMSGLDISEKRLPQDGRFSIRVHDVPVDVRISTMPTQHGESVVMRLLNQSGGMLGLDKLGMPSDMLEKFRAIIQRTTGMVLVTGPTGSGKTTTLYAALTEMNTVDKKIITVEDPVEYRLPGINQIQVNEKIDLTFSRVLRSSMRQDPDIILVGEMRDQETAEIGLRAAITGHMVLSTLHTRDAASTPLRLVDMGAPRYMVASSLHAVLAQRLVRVICESCADAYTPTAQEKEWLNHVILERRALRRSVPPTAQEKEWLNHAMGGPGESTRESLPGEPTPLRLMHGRGCSRCNMSGYHGRTGVYEMLEMTPALVEAASRDDPAQFIHTAQTHMVGMTLRDHSISLVRSGKTTVSEIMRITTQMED